MSSDRTDVRAAPVTRADFPHWKRLRQAVYSDLDESFHDAEMEWLFASPEAASFLVWPDDGDRCEPIGLLELTRRNFVDGCIGGPVGYIEGLYLVPEARGRGLGGRLIAFAADWFRSRGCRQMVTDAELSNALAQAFYRRMGFAERWRTVGFTRGLDGGEPTAAPPSSTA